MILKTLYCIYLLAVPAVVIWLAKRWSWIERISPMPILYALGLLVANTTTIPSSIGSSFHTAIGNIAVPLSIPLMLLSCNPKQWSAAKTAKAFLCGFLAVVITIITGFFLFKGIVGNEMAQICAVAAGIYTGGIPNMGAIAHGVNMNNEMYLLLTSYDLIVTGLYLTFIIFCGKTFYRKLLPNRHIASTNHTSNSSRPITPTKNTSPKEGRATLFCVLLAIGIVSISYYVSTLFDTEYSTPILILLISTISIAASFLPHIRQTATATGSNTPTCFNIGLYCVYVFCFCIANGCNIREMELLSSLPVLGFIAFVVFGSILLQILFSIILHLDGDTVMVTSVSLINSPPFVPMAAALLNNRDTIILGIGVGLLGYLAGNYLGIGLFLLLR